MQGPQVLATDERLRQKCSTIAGKLRASIAAALREEARQSTGAAAASPSHARARAEEYRALWLHCQAELLCPAPAAEWFTCHRAVSSVGRFNGHSNCMGYLPALSACVANANKNTREANSADIKWPWPELQRCMMSR